MFVFKPQIFCYKCPQVGAATVDGGIPDGCMGLDIGPKTTDQFKAAILKAKTIVWNGSVMCYPSCVSIGNN